MGLTDLKSVIELSDSIRSKICGLILVSDDTLCYWIDSIRTRYPILLSWMAGLKKKKRVSPKTSGGIPSGAGKTSHDINRSTKIKLGSFVSPNSPIHARGGINVNVSRLPVASPRPGQDFQHSLNQRPAHGNSYLSHNQQGTLYNTPTPSFFNAPLQYQHAPTHENASFSLSPGYMDHANYQTGMPNAMMMGQQHIHQRASSQASSQVSSSPLVPTYSPMNQDRIHASMMSPPIPGYIPISQQQRFIHPLNQPAPQFRAPSPQIPLKRLADDALPQRDPQKKSKSDAYVNQKMPRAIFTPARPRIIFLQDISDHQEKSNKLMKEQQKVLTFEEISCGARKAPEPMAWSKIMIERLFANVTNETRIMDTHTSLPTYSFKQEQAVESVSADEAGMFKNAFDEWFSFYC
jgi:hypothetical protein